MQTSVQEVSFIQIQLWALFMSLLMSLLAHFRNHAIHPFLVRKALPEQSPPNPMRLSDHSMVLHRRIENFHSEVSLSESI